MPNSSSCIDLIFTDQPNLILDSGIHSSLHPICHHQIIYSKINLSIEYPPPYERIVWDYKKADIAHINFAIDGFNWVNLFEGKNIDEQVHAFDETLLNIFKNFIPHKIITFNDSDPPWINEEIKSKIQLKNQYYMHYVRNGRNATDYINLKRYTNDLSNLITERKNQHYIKLGMKLNDPNSNRKNYWSI